MKKLPLIYIALLACSLCLSCGAEADEDSPQSTCGNGELEPGESCDDGNTESLDGCSATCSNEAPMCTRSAECKDGKQCVASKVTAGAFVCGNPPTACGQLHDSTEQNDFCARQSTGSFCNAEGTCSVPASCSDTATPDAYCQETMQNDLATCKDSTCVIAEPTLPPTSSYIVIADHTTDYCTREEDSNTFDPGSDLMYVALRSRDGHTIEWGRATYASDLSGDFNNFEIINGEAPPLDDSGCPSGDQGNRFNEETVFTMGCGGFLIVEFQTVITDEHIVTIGEYAPICNDGSGDPYGSDQYNAYICWDSPGADEALIDYVDGCIQNSSPICSSHGGGIKDCNL